MSPVFVCCRYLESNLRSLSTVWAYDARVPTYLHNQPRHFVKHCMRSLPPVANDFLASDITETDIATNVVCSGPSQSTVTMTVPVPSCECVDWDRHYLPCKHMLAIARHHSWEELPLEYRQFPFFVIDEEVIGCRVPQVEELIISEEDIEVMKFVCTCVCVSAAYHDTVEQTGECLYRCHPHHRLRRESSLSTLTGEELDAFAETLPTEVHSTQQFCRHRNFLRFRWWIPCVKYGVNTACNSPRTHWNITRYCGMLNVCLFVIQYQFSIFNVKKLLRHIAILCVHIWTH